MRNSTQLTISAIAIAALTACSSSSTTDDTGNATVEGLNTPTQLSIVSASEATAGGGGAVTAGAGATDFPATSHYNTDSADTWVYDPAVEPISQVNEILCMISQTRAGAMVNRGAYTAQIDTTRCEQGADGGGGDDSQSSGTTTEFEFWTVDSTRATNTDPQVVHVWVPGEQGSDENIFVEALVTSGVSATNPFGVFSMDFAAAASFDLIDTPTFFGSLNTTNTDTGIGFTFYNDFAIDAPGEVFQELVAVNVAMAADQESGFARVYRDFDGVFDFGAVTEEEDYTVAFNETHLLRSDGTNEVCLSREEFDTKVWRYNLYHADGANLGQRVELNSGFGFRTEDDDYGWIGYYGMWTPEGVEVENGDTITEDIWGEENPAEYTVFQAPGRLIRYARETVSLADITGEVFEAWLYDEQSFENENYQLVHNGDDWTKVAVMDVETFEWVPLEAPVLLTLQNGEWLGMWSQSLGGSVDYIHGDACLCVTVYSERFVTPSDDIFSGVDSITLYGFQDMLESGITQEDAELGDIFLDESVDVQQPHTFTFDVATMTLLDANEDAVGLAAGATPESGPNTWGMRSGPMLLSLVGLENTWDVFGEEVYYVWETGHNEWNRYTAVLDANDEVAAFDPPIQFSYQHTTAADRNGDTEYDGSIYFLNYEGPGNLWGIPHEGVDLDGDEQEDRWYPLFSIEDGVAMGPTGEEYVIRAIEMEQTLAPADGECGALSLTDAANLVLPTAAGFDTPEIGDPPTVNDPPAVVEGVVQVTE